MKIRDIVDSEDNDVLSDNSGTLNCPLVVSTITRGGSGKSILIKIGENYHTVTRHSKVNFKSKVN
jgi:hypothetical protein